jgi:hypothetical protein
MLEVIGHAVWYGSNGTALDAFPELLRLHLNRTRGAVDLEAQARRVASAGFPPADLEVFIRGVCTWGGCPGMAGRVLARNAPESVAAAFRQAYRELAADRSGHESAAAALSEINRIKGLGAPSFASKHLRFLAPSQCPVLDSLIATTCDYPFTVSGYARYAADCATIAAALEAEGIRNPSPGSPDVWRVADVDAALFASIRAWG